MLDNVKSFVKKHRGKIIAGVVTTTGVIIAYNCGTHEVIARLRGNAYETLLTPDHKWCEHVHKFLAASTDNQKAYLHEIDIPKEKLVDEIAEARDALKEGYNTINVLMVAKK